MSEEKRQDDDFVIERRKKYSDMMNDLESLDEYVLPSSVMQKTEEKKEKTKEEESDLDWLSSLDAMPTLNFNKKLSKHFMDGYELKTSSKKGKKKKKDKTGLTNYSKEFQRELATLQNLQIQQNEFVDRLQATYNQMAATKSSARGIGKYTTDLISNINSARSLSKDLAKEIIATKKTVADLTMREKKELGLLHAEGEDVGSYASSFLKQIISGDRKTLSSGGDPAFDVVDDDSEFDTALENSFVGRENDINRSDESELYLKYENQDITVKCALHDDGTYEFIAFDDEDNVVPDYPVPDSKTEININRETGRVRDSFGVSYPIIYD
nr:MAG TPA: hypothetical protein [Caudoviricetes sp.]